MQEVNLSTPVDADAAGLDDGVLRQLRDALQQRIHAGRLPGAVMLVARRGAIGCFEALGRLDPSHDTPMACDAIFRIYSMSKPVVSVAAMRLMEQGRLFLEDPVARHLPEFAGTQVAIERGGRLEFVAPKRPMTVHDLLRHTSGMTYEFLAPAPVRQLYATARVWSQDRSNAEASQCLAGLPLMHEPGSVWDYSRATDVLSRVIEVVSGQALGAHLRDAVFGPLGMNDTGFHVPAASHERIAEPFARDPDNGSAVKLSEIRRSMPRESGGGGLVSTAADYARFLQMLLAGGSLGGVRLLGPSTVEFMTSDHLGGIPSTGDLLAPGHGFGLGFAVRLATGIAPNPGSAGLYYWGGIAGTTFFVDPKEGMFALLLTQAPGQREELRALFRNMVYAALRR
jgi:CubicO group peptidase (beta-lactamase class C family)